MLTRVGATADLPLWIALLAIALAVVSFALLLVEQGRRDRPDWKLATTGMAATVTLLAAVLRPALFSVRETVVGAHVLVLADTSRSMALTDGSGKTRADVRDGILDELRSSNKDTRNLRPRVRRRTSGTIRSAVIRRPAERPGRRTACARDVLPRETCRRSRRERRPTG